MLVGRRLKIYVDVSLEKSLILKLNNKPHSHRIIAFIFFCFKMEMSWQKYLGEKII